MSKKLQVKYFRESFERVPYKPDNEENITGKIVLITGGNSGIGEIAALEMAKRGAIVVMACRDMTKARTVVKKIKSKVSGCNLVLMELDLGSVSSVRKCVTNFKAKFDHIDILINNAGVFFDDGKLHHTTDGFEIHMGINHLGHFLFTLLLLNLVKKAAPSRIINVSSGMFEIGKLDVDDLNLEISGVDSTATIGPYANSKLANVYFTRALAKRLEGTGVTTYALCPGMVKTDITRNTVVDSNYQEDMGKQFILTPEEGVETILYCSLSKECAKESGEMYRFCKLYQGMPKLDSDIEEDLWTKSKVLVEV